MIEHIVLLKLKEGITKEQTQAMMDGLEELKKVIPGMLEVSGGYNNSPENKAEGFSFGFIVRFKDAASREAKDLVSRAEGKDEREYAAAASLILAQVEVDRDNIVQAATHYRVSAEYGSTSEMRTTAYRDLGEMLNRLGEYERSRSRSPWPGRGSCFLRRRRRSWPSR